LISGDSMGVVRGDAISGSMGLVLPVRVGVGIVPEKTGSCRRMRAEGLDDGRGADDGFVGVCRGVGCEVGLDSGPGLAVGFVGGAVGAAGPGIGSISIGISSRTVAACLTG
jgi:hypothetical protein